MAHEEWNIFWTLPQWGHVHRKDVDPIKQIGPEPLRLDQCGEILVRGSDEPGIRAQGARAAEAFKRPCLQDPQQFRLHFEREFPNLIEKHGPPVRQFEATKALRHRPCKRPSLVSEEFTFEQADRNGCAVELDEGLGGAWAELMNGACDQLFARTGLSGDEHGRLGRRDGLYLVQHLAEGGAVAHNVRKVQLTADFPFQIQLLLPELVCERRDLTIGERVLDRDGHLVGDLGEEIDLVWGKGLLLEAGEQQHAQDTMAAQEWEKTAGLQPLHRPDLVNRGMEPVWATEGEGLARLEDLPRGR